MSIVEYFKEHEGYRCGYCHSPNTNFSHGMWAHALTVDDYEGLLNRGWRRSGMYCYKPTNSVTCCPMYTINCHALLFKPSKSHKKICNRMSTFLRNNPPPSTSPHPPNPPIPKTMEKEGGATKSKSTSGGEKSLEEYIEEGDESGRLVIQRIVSGGDEHERVMKEEFLLYKKYQVTIHGDKEEECNLKQFKRFLCDSPLQEEKDGMGSYHQLYYLDSKLIAVGVIDILPTSLSSVYLFYDPAYSDLSLGTYSALREIHYIRQIHKTRPQLEYYYMGYYIHSCVKMRYKAQFQPSFLHCPLTPNWVKLDDALRAKLEKDKYCPFTQSDNPQQVIDINKVQVLYRKSILPYEIYELRKGSKDKAEIEQYAGLVGNELAGSLLLYRA